MRIAANLISIALLLFAGLCHAEDCKQALNTHGPAAMQLSVDEFDQGVQGWRTLGNQGCFAEAATLIERYALSYDSKYRALKWHLAQMHASAGNNPSAIAAAQISLSPVQEKLHPEFDWNSYVNATIAFLRRDRVSFDSHRAALKIVAARSAANAPNDEALDRLSRCFDKPYADAYACNAP